MYDEKATQQADRHRWKLAGEEIFLRSWQKLNQSQKKMLFLLPSGVCFWVFLAPSGQKVNQCSLNAARWGIFEDCTYGECIQTQIEHFRLFLLWVKCNTIQESVRPLQSNVLSECFLAFCCPVSMSSYYCLYSCVSLVSLCLWDAFLFHFLCKHRLICL